MDRDKQQKLRTLFLSALQLSASTFGGGFVIVSLMRKKFVQQLHWIDEEEMMDLTAIAQSASGPIAVNASLLVGYRTAGVPGALLSVLGTVLPPLLIITVISMFYSAFRDNAVVSALMAGMLAGAAAVIFDVVISMAKSILRLKRVLPVLVLAGSFILVYFLNANMLLVLAGCGVIGAVDTMYHEKAKRKIF